MVDRRRGVTLIEATAAAFVAATMIGICFQMLTALAFQQRTAERRSWAIETATNLMERIATQDYGEITSEAAAQVVLGPEVKQVLPDAELEIEVIEQQTPIVAKQIRLSLQWVELHGRTGPKVYLSSWVFQDGRPAL